MTITAEFVGELVYYTTIAFCVFMTALMLIYWTTFRGRKLTGESIALIIERTEIPKLATIILIIVAATFLALLELVEGESVITILSGIAGYVLGGRANMKEDRPPRKPQPPIATTDTSSSTAAQ